MGEQRRNVRSLQKLATQQEMSFSEKVIAAKRLEARRKGARRSNVVAHGSNVPILMNLDIDGRLSGRQQHPLLEGSTTIGGHDIGENDDSDGCDGKPRTDIVIDAVGLPPILATVINTAGHCRLVCAGCDAPKAVWINGKLFADLIGQQPVSDDDHHHSHMVSLKDKDRVTFVRYIYVFVDPSVTRMPETLLLNGSINFSDARAELPSNWNIAVKNYFKSVDHDDSESDCSSHNVEEDYCAGGASTDSGGTQRSLQGGSAHSEDGPITICRNCHNVCAYTKFSRSELIAEVTSKDVELKKLRLESKAISCRPQNSTVVSFTTNSNLLARVRQLKSDIDSNFDVAIKNVNLTRELLARPTPSSA